MEFKNKTILFLGSSVTYGSASQGVSFVDIIRDTCGSNCIKEAVSGTTLADIEERSYVSRLRKVDPNLPVDLFICQLSTNDAAKKIELSKTEEAIRFILEYVQKTFHCPMAFYTGTYFNSERYEQMIALLYELKKEYAFEILDMFNDPEMRAIDPELYREYMRDPVHPRLVGYQEWWTPKFVEFIKQLP